MDPKMHWIYHLPVHLAWFGSKQRNRSFLFIGEGQAAMSLWVGAETWPRGHLKPAVVSEEFGWRFVWMEDLQHLAWSWGLFGAPLGWGGSTEIPPATREDV